MCPHSSDPITCSLINLSRDFWRTCLLCDLMRWLVQVALLTCCFFTVAHMIKTFIVIKYNVQFCTQSFNPHQTKSALVAIFPGSCPPPLHHVFLPPCDFCTTNSYNVKEVRIYTFYFYPLRITGIKVMRSTTEEKGYYLYQVLMIVLQII